MDSYLNETYCSQELERIDRKIEVTVSEISKFIRDLVDQNSGVKKSKEGKVRVDENRELINVLQTVLHFLHDNPGFEELLLPHVGELRLQNGLNLSTYPVRPCSCIEGEKDTRSHSKVTTSVIALWELLSSHLEDYVSKKLTVLFELPIWSEMRSQVWSNYLNTLHVIWTPTRLWEFHMKMRKQYFRYFRCPCAVGSDRYCLECFMLVCLQCLTEDAEMIGMGCFQPSVITWTELYGLYGEKIATFTTKFICSISRAFNERTASTLPKILKCLTKSFLCKGELHSVQRRFSVIEPSERQQFSDSNIRDFYRDMQNILLKTIEVLNFYDRQIMLLAGTEALTTKSSLKAALTSLPDLSPEESPVHQENASSEDFAFLWDWKLLIVREGLLTLIQKQLQQQASEVIQHNLRKEWTFFQSNEEISVVEVIYDSEIYNVMGSIVAITEELDKYLPILAVSQGLFLPFQSSFSHIIHTYLIDIFRHINKLTANGSMECVCPALSSCVFLRLKLLSYVTCMAGPNGASQPEDSAVGTIYKRLEQEIESMKLTILAWHSKILVCGVLNDSESHNWQDNKAFYEGKRVSFSVQMWNFYMKSLKHRLIRMLPSKFAQEVYLQLLEESMTVFESRYAKACPSEARVSQLRADITCILKCVVELLPFACNSLREFLGIPTTEIPENNRLVSAIHSHCCALLVIMVVLTCPFSNLYKAFKKGFIQMPSVSRKTKKVPLRVSRWFHWVEPFLFPLGGQVLSTIQVWLCTYLCTVQPKLSWHLTVQALTMHSCTLAILLVTQSVQNDFISVPKLAAFLTSILGVLKHCSHQPECISNVLFPIINFSEQGWNVFDGLDAVMKPWEDRPWWYLCIIKLLKPTIKGVLCSTLPKYLQQSDVLASSRFEEWRTVYLHLRRVVRCCCNNQLTTDVSAIKAACTLEMIRFLVDHIQTLPTTLLVTMASLRMHLCKANSKVTPFWDCIGIQIIADIIHNSLNDTDVLCEYLGMGVQGAAFDFCKDVANFFLDLILPERVTLGENIPPPCLESSNLCLSQLCKIFKSYQPESLDKMDIPEDILEAGCLEITVTNILQEDEGRETISYLYQILCVNKKWIQHNLGIYNLISLMAPKSAAAESEVLETKSNSEDLPVSDFQLLATSGPAEPILTLDVETATANGLGEFIVFEEFCSIGNNAFNNDTLMNFSYSWESLMSYLLLLGLTETMFCALLDHRWEMHHSADLSDTDKGSVEILRSLFSVDKSTSGKNE